MTDSTEVRALLLQISASTELLKSNLATADRAIKDFHESTQQHLDDTDSRFEKFGKSIEKVAAPLENLKRLGELAIAATIGESLKEAGEKALEFAGNVQFVAEQVGVSTDFLQKYRYAAGQFGVGTEEAQTGLGKFTRSIGEAANGNSQLIALFNRLGVKVRDAAGNVRSTEAVFKDVANAIAKIDNPGQRAADVMTLFGRGSIGLVPLLQQGAAGFNDLAKAAEQLGIVLSPELIEHSEQVNHKLAALKQILDAQLSSAIAQNAEAIGNLASEVIKLAGGLAQLAGQHPEIVEALLGAAVGGRIAGLPGALVLGAAGYVHGGIQQQQGIEETKDVAVARQQLAEAQAHLQSLRSRAQFQGSLGGSTMTLLGSIGGAEGGLAAPSDGYSFVSKDALLAAQAAVKLWQKRYADAVKAKPEGEALGSGGAGATNDNGDALKKAQDEIAQLEQAKKTASGSALTAINEEVAQRRREIALLKSGMAPELAKQLASKEGAEITKSANQSKRDADKAIKDQLAYSQQELELRKKLLAGAAKSVGNDEARDKLEKAIIDAEAATLTEQIKQRYKRGDYGDPNSTGAKAERDNLLNLNEAVRQEGNSNVDRNALARTQQVTFDAAQAKLNEQISMLQLDSGLATTREQRLQLALDLLDAQNRAAKSQNDKIIADFAAGLNNRTPAEADAAAARNKAIDDEDEKKRKAIQQNNASPSQQFMRDLNAQSINDQLEQVDVNGLKALEGSLTDIISGTKSVSAAFKDMADQIIASLLKIAIEQAIVKPLAGMLGFSTGDVPGHATGMIPGFADGIIRGPGTGRSDSILALMAGKGLIRVSNGESIINAESTRRYRPLLKAINDKKLPGFADGLVDPGMISMPTVTKADMRQIASSRGGGGFQISVDARGATDPSAVKRMVQDGIAQAAPYIIEAAKGRTITALRRPSLPGGLG
jgi:hypothetical protein